MEVKIEIKLTPGDVKENIIDATEGDGYRLMEEAIRGEDTYLIFHQFNFQQWLEDNVRSRRDQLLQDSDKMMLADVAEGLSVEEYAAWKAYRQALRDLPQNFDKITQPVEIVWPEKPQPKEEEIEK